MTQKTIFIMILVILFPVLLSADVVHVPADYPTIQTAIDAASNGDTIQLDNGIYAGEGNYNLEITGKILTIESAGNPAECSIDCEEHGRAMSIADSQITISGISIMNGLKNHYAGILITDQSTVNIIDCIIIQNYAMGGMDTASAGGVGCFDSEVNFLDTEISENSGSAYDGMRGAGVYSSDCELRFEHCSFRNNGTSSYCDRGIYGGALMMHGGSLELRNSTFIENAACSGSCIAVVGVEATIESTIFEKNIAGEQGICIDTMGSSIKVINCVFADNHADTTTQNYDTAVIFNCGTQLQMENCTICSNNGNLAGGGLQLLESSNRLTSARLKNSILWGNSPNEISVAGVVDLQVAFSDIEGFPVNGIGLIALDPQFIGGNPYDYHLSSVSPCIDAGTNQNAVSTDLEGNNRPGGEVVDLGAYEYPGRPDIPHVYVDMPSHLFSAGDTVDCKARIWNPSSQYMSGYRLFAVLDVYGSYYFAPDFSSMDSYPVDAAPGITEISIIASFSWPENVGSASGIFWYGFLTDPSITQLSGSIGAFDFGWQ